MAKYGFKSEAEKEQERFIREQKKEESGRAELERIEGSKVVPSELRKAVEEKNTRASIKKQALESGMSEDEANRAVAESGIGSVTPRLDRMAGEQRRLEESRAANPDPNLQGFKTYGDKARFETQNAIRKLQGRQQLTPDTPEQFRQDIGTSMGFGEKSALLTPEGQARAIGKGVKSGLSPEAANAAVQRAFKTLKGTTEGKAAAGVPPMLARPQEVAPTARGAAPKPPVEVTPTPVKPSAVSEVFLGENQEGAEGSPTRGVIRGTKAGATVYGALEKKVGGARNIVEEYNKSGIGSRLDDLKTSAADATKATERAAARMQKFEDTWKGKFPKAGSASERAAVSEYNNLKERLDTAEGRQAASNKLAQEASEATSKAAAAEKVVGGIGSKIVGAGEKVGKFFAPLAPLAKPLAPVARIAGKVAGPAFEIYDAAKYFTGDEGEKAKYAESAATLGSRLFTPKSGGEFLGAVGDVLSPTKNVLGVVESGRQLSRSSRDARESEAAADTAQKLFDARQAARRADYTDEQFKALSQKDRTDYLKKLRERVKVK